MKDVCYIATFSRPTQFCQENVSLTLCELATPSLFLVQKTKSGFISWGIYHIFTLHELA